MNILFLGPIAVKTTVICADLQFYLLSSLNILNLSAIHLQSLSSKDKVDGKNIKNKPLWICCTHSDLCIVAWGCLQAVSHISVSANNDIKIIITNYLLKMHRWYIPLSYAKHYT